MKCDAKVCFINNRYIIGDINLKKVYGVKIIKAYLKPLGRIFSADSIIRIAQAPEMQQTRLRVITVENEKLDASVIKIPFGDSIIMVMELYNVPITFSVERYEKDAAVSESIVDDFLTNVSMELAKIETAKNRKNIEKIREMCLYFGGSILEMLHFALTNNIENTNLQRVYTDVWSYLSEISEELLRYGDVEFINNAGKYVHNCVAVQRIPLKNLLIALVSYFSENGSNGKRIYVCYFKTVNDTILCVSNYKYVQIEKVVWGMNCSDENSNKMINLINLAARAGVSIQHNFDKSNGEQAFLLSFGSDKRARLCEEGL